jgi:hypothetical protein
LKTMDLLIWKPWISWLKTMDLLIWKPWISWLKTMDLLIWKLNRISWIQSYDFWMYSYNASVVVGWSVFTSEKIIFILKSRYAVRRVINFYNSGVVTRDRRIGSWPLQFVGPVLNNSTITLTSTGTDVLVSKIFSPKIAVCYSKYILVATIFGSFQAGWPGWAIFGCFVFQTTTLYPGGIRTHDP